MQTAPARPDRRRALARPLAAATAAGAALALSLTGAPAALADDCPNAAVRAQQNATYLPDCRAYELASPVDKQGQMVRASRPFVRPDGGAAMFRANGAMAGALANIGGDYVVRRTDAGWVTTPYILPMTHGLRIATLSDASEVVALDEQFEQALVTTSYPFDPDDLGRLSGTQEYTGDDVFRWAPGQVPFWLSRPIAAPDLSSAGADVTWAAPDLGRVLVSSSKALSSDLPSPTGQQQYLYADGQPAVLLSADPDGVPFATATVPRTLDGDTIVLYADSRLWLRTDAADPQLARTAELTWGPDRATCANVGSAFVLGADGGELLFQCLVPLRAGEAIGTTYRGDLRTGEAVPIAAAAVLGASDDLRRVLLRGDGRLLYADEDGVREIADPGFGFWSVDQLMLSADGSTVTFSSDGDLGFPDGGFEQVYRYDAEAEGGAGELTCVSCYRDGREATGISSIQARTYVSDNRFEPRRGALSRDGRRLFFNSANALVARDVNNQPDAYLLQDGALHLLGPGDDRTGTAFAYASDDGDTAFVYATENLVPQDVDNGVNDLYAVRVGGGFLAPEPAAPCTIGCQGPLPPLEQVQTPGTVVFAGPGDVDDAAQPAVVKVFGVTGIGTRARARWARGARAAVQVRLSHAGTATAVMRARIGRRSLVVARVSRRAAGGGTVALPLRLSGRARTALRRQGALRTTVRVTVPGAGGAQTASFTLRTAKAKRGGR